MMPRLNLVGQRFDRLLVMEAHSTTPSGQIWLCRCDCGRECLKLTTQLRRKTQINHGCKSCEPVVRSDGMTKHGGSRKNTDRAEPLYQVWKSMRNRCADNDNPHYGGKGIRVCAEWDTYPAFRAWALANGYWHDGAIQRCDRLAIDRINPMLDYSPDNCRWITGRENSRSTRQSA